VLRIWQLVGYWAVQQKLRLLISCASVALVLLAVFTFPGPRPVTLAPSASRSTIAPQHSQRPPVGRHAGHQQATVGPPRFTARPPRVIDRIILSAPQVRKRTRSRLLSVNGSHVLRVPVGSLLPADGIPTIALNAYIHAETLLRLSNPHCRISWEDLAGIGRIESDNGQTWGSAARVTRNGTLYPPILGPILDGQNGMPAIPTTDHGVLEFNPVWSRAVGPMQFLPSTWYAYARSGSADKVPNPQNFYDATLTAGTYLCANGGDLGTKTGLTNAIYAYNHSSYYVSLVEQWIAFYSAEGAQVLLATGASIPVGNGNSKPKPPKKGGSQHHPQAPGSSGSGNSGGGGVVPASASLATAVLKSDSAGTFSFQLQVFDGKTQVASGIASVNYVRHQAEMSIRPSGAGWVKVRVIGSHAWLWLPAGLAAVTHTSPGVWQPSTARLIGQMPLAIGDYLNLLTHDAVWSIAELEGVTNQVVHAGVVRRHGTTFDRYRGRVSLVLAAKRVAAATHDFTDISKVIGSREVAVTAEVSGRGLLYSTDLLLGRLRGTSAMASLLLSFYAYGRPVTVTVPSSPPPTTTTTTTSTTTSTTVPVTTVTSPSTTTSTTSGGTSSTISAKRIGGNTGS
jgi:membrane-bound lytic murein transglycosylase B